MRPYIGVTDVPDRTVVSDLLETFMEHRRTPDTDPRSYRLHIGAMTSYKYLYGLSAKWRAVWPKAEELAGIFSYRDSTIYNCLHYADFRPEASDGLADHLNRAVEPCGPHLHAVQLDMVWPDPDELARFRAKHDPLGIVLQIGDAAFKRVHNDPERLVNRLQGYGSSVTRVLLDTSGGAGKALDASALMPFLRRLRTDLPQLGLGVAGGLGPESMHLIKPLVAEFPRLSVDAQGRLRSSGDSLQPLEYQRAATYVAAALQLLDR